MSTLQIIEGTPASRPALSLLDIQVAPAVVWSRIEEWIAYRWGVRDCSFIVEGGCGAWRAPLTPFTVATVDVWHDDWQPVTLTPHPLGGLVIGDSEAYRLTGTAGSATPPPAEVVEAARRLQAFWAAAAGEDKGSTQESRTEGDLTANVTRSRDWLARAIHSSGAADLLRKYRRAP